MAVLKLVSLVIALFLLHDRFLQLEARSHDNDDREGDFKDEDWHAGDDDDDDDDRHHHGSRGHHHRGDGEHERGCKRSKRVKRIAAIACGSVGLLAFIVFVAVLVVKRNKLRLYFAKRNNSVYVSMNDVPFKKVKVVENDYALPEKKPLE